MRIIRHKFSAVKSKCNAGHYHPSKLEGGYCNQLQLLVKAKEIYCFEYERRFELRVYGNLIGHHKPDFCVYKTKDDFEKDFFEVHECKGVTTTDFNLRRKLFEAIYNHIEYILIK